MNSMDSVIALNGCAMTKTWWSRRWL